MMFLRVSREIERVKRQGVRVATPCFNLLIERKTGRASQVAIVVGRRFGHAVRRNRVKRVFRALVRTTYKDIQLGHNLVVFPKREALESSHEDLADVWRTVLRKYHVMRTET